MADIRRIAEGIDLNDQDLKHRQNNREVLKYGDGHVVKFDNDRPATFFKEYLEDVANVAGMDEKAVLKFPDQVVI